MISVKEIFFMASKTCLVVGTAGYIMEIKEDSFMNEKYANLLKNSNYIKFLSANLINRFGDCIDAMAMTWLMYQVSGSASASALNYGLNYIPTILLQPICGAFVEKRDIKKIMLVSDMLRFVIIGSAAVLTLTGKIQAWMIIVGTFLISTVEAFRVPAQTPMVTLILDEEEYTVGESVSSSLSQIVQMVSIGIAGFLVTWLGTSTCILIDCGCFIISMLLIAGMNIKKTRTVESGSDLLKDTVEGYRYLKKNRTVVLICVTAVLLNALIAPLSALEAAICDEMFHRGPEIISLINVFFTLGGIAGSILFPKVEEKVRPSVLLSACFMTLAVFYGAVIVCSHVYENAILVYALMALTPFLVGLAAAFVNVFVAVTQLKTVESSYLSRVTAIGTSLSQRGIPVTSFLISLGATRLSVYQLIAVTCGMAVLSGLLFVSNGKIRNSF